jgi:cellulase/cellobiase CelA1
MVRRILIGAVVATVLASVAVVTGPSAAVAAPCTSTAPIQINSLIFNPPKVSPGQSSTATAVVQNCTNQALTLSSYWYGRYSSPPSNGIPPGCLALDPLPRTLNLPASATVTVNSTWLGFPSCTATLFTLIYHITAPDNTVVQASADLAIGAVTTPPCSVSYVRQSEWAGGFVANVTIRNTSAGPIANWTLLFTFNGDQRITNAWNATVSQSGAQVSARGPAYQPTIAANSTYTFGFQGTWHVSDAPPTSFTLNGTACTTA